MKMRCIFWDIRTKSLAFTKSEFALIVYVTVIQTLGQLCSNTLKLSYTSASGLGRWC